MHYVELIAILALLQYFLFTILLGRTRKRAGITPPAITGDAAFERMYRVQMNTLELLMMLLPGLLIASKFWPEHWVAGMGIIYLVARIAYWRAYVDAHKTRREWAFACSLLPILALLILGTLGALGYGPSPDSL